jgi:hypothetical protein
MSIFGCLVTCSTVLFGVEGFRALGDDYAAKAAFVESLRKVKLKNIEIKDASIDEAVAALNESLRRGNHPRMNFVIRKSQIEGNAKDPFAQEDTKPSKPKTVTLKADEMDFGSAIDQACQQAGLLWLIDIDSETRVVTLVIAPNSQKR